MVIIVAEDLILLSSVLSFLDDLSSKANIVIDPSELQAVTMDDLEEEDESASLTGQVQKKETRHCKQCIAAAGQRVFKY